MIGSGFFVRYPLIESRTRLSLRPESFGILSSCGLKLLLASTLKTGPHKSGLFYLRLAENCTQTTWNQRVAEDKNKLKLNLATEARMRMIDEEPTNSMKQITQEELNEAIRLHGLWLQGEAMGVRADLRGSDLRGSNLSDSDGKDSKVKLAMGWVGLYRYFVFVAITEQGTFVRMGCHWRSLAEWEADFWNNPKEFPNDGSAKSNMRLAAFNYVKEWIKNNS